MSVNFPQTISMVHELQKSKISTNVQMQGQFRKNIDIDINYKCLHRVKSIWLYPQTILKSYFTFLEFADFESINICNILKDTRERKREKLFVLNFF